MNYRNLGRTGVQVSPLCLGCMNFGGRTSPEDSYAIIDYALDFSINFLDTENVYHRGESEKVVGEALKRNGKRESTILATKVHGTMDDEDPPEGTRYDQAKDMPHMQKRLRDAAFDAIEELKTLAEEKELPLSQYALAWNFQQPGITSSIIGPRTLDQLKDNLQALDFDWTSEDQEKIDRVVPPGEMVSPFYGADFGPHHHRV